MPSFEALHCNSKTLAKSGRERTGASASFLLMILKLYPASITHLNALYFMQSVIGATKELKF